MNRLIYENELPKGMEPPEAPGQHNKPALLDLGIGNYVGAIRQALRLLPVEIRVNKCLVLEREGQYPEVRLSLTVLGEKEGYSERKRSRIQPAVEDVCSEGTGRKVCAERARADRKPGDSRE